MILTRGLVSVNLGRASAMTPIVAEVRQTVITTASGLDYTNTFNYYMRGGFKFDFGDLETTLYDDLIDFILFEAEGSKNNFGLTLDNDVTHATCYFADKGKVTAGELETLGTATGIKHVYLNVSFGIKIHA